MFVVEVVIIVVNSCFMLFSKKRSSILQQFKFEFTLLLHLIHLTIIQNVFNEVFNKYTRLSTDATNEQKVFNGMYIKYGRLSNEALTILR